MRPLIPLTLCLLPAALAVGSCASLDQAFQETILGKEKRHIMVGRVESARDEQTQAKEQFKSTLERFKELTGADGGELEDIYDALKDDYEQCAEDAEDVGERIDGIEAVADDMFDEWRSEIDEISNRDYQRKSEDLLRDTERKYDSMLEAMRDAESKMKPVLIAFNDQVLFLKHNLNAQLISEMQSTVVEIEQDVDRLIEEMERSIAEADSFIEEMNSNS